MLAGVDIATLVAEAGIFVAVGWFVIHKFWPKGAAVENTVSNVIVDATTYGNDVVADVKADIEYIKTFVSSLETRIEEMEANVKVFASKFALNVVTKATLTEKTAMNLAEHAISNVVTEVKNVEVKAGEVDKVVVSDVEKTVTDVKEVINGVVAETPRIHPGANI